MANINEIINAIPKKNRIIIMWFLWMCWVAWFVVPTLLNNEGWDSYSDSWNPSISWTSTWVVTTNWTNIHVWEPTEVKQEIKENNLFSYTMNWKEYSFKVDKDGWSHILLGWLKTSAWHENNILVLISVNPKKEKVSYNIIDPRVSFNDWSINPQNIENWTALMNAVWKDLWIEIQYYWTLWKNSLWDLVRNFIDTTTKVYENWINVGSTYIKDNASWFDLLTANKWTSTNQEIVSKFLDEVTFDHSRNKFDTVIFDLFWKEWVWNNLTTLELESLWNLLKKDWWTEPKKYNKTFNMFILWNEAGFYETVTKENVDWSKTWYWKLTQKTIDIIKDSLK